MRITFCGAAESVTGSCHLVEADGATGARFLLDCGQFQGSAKQDAQNYEPFPFDPAQIDFLILSHAHVDHCGRIPLLVKRGFRGRIYCTDATADLLPIMLRDSAHIHEKEAEWKNRKGQRAGKEPVEPLYTTADAVASLSFVTPARYDQEIRPTDDVRFSFSDAGHILGSAITEIWIRESGGGETKLVFSGDLGMESKPLLRDPVRIRQADVVVMETTYGGRLHDRSAPTLARLVEIIEKTTKRGGTVLIPSFAVGRTQELIYELNKFYEQSGKTDNAFKDIDVYIDSPMASAATEVFRKNIQDFDDEYKARVMKGDDPLDFSNLIFTSDAEASKALNASFEPKIIISASGMCEAGRIRHHLKHRLWGKKSTVVFVGYQAEGTLGRKIIEGAKTVSLFGEEVDVNAEIVNLEGFSAHADRDGLLDWARGFDAPPSAFFLVHGEASAKAAFAKTLYDELGVRAIVIEKYTSYTYTAGSGVQTGVGEVGGGEVGGAGKNESVGAGVRAFVGGVDSDDLSRTLAKLRDVGDNVEGLLYRARLAALDAEENGDAESYTALKNIVVSLEYDMSKLAGELASGRKL